MAATGALGELAEVLNNTLVVDNERRAQAEAKLREAEANPWYSQSLLQLATSTLPNQTRLAAALAFKNFIKKNYRWLVKEQRHTLPDEQVSFLKRELVGQMIASPRNIQAQLGAAITIIAEQDFHERWNELMPDIASRLSADDFTVTNGVLTMAHTILESLRYADGADDDARGNVVHAMENLGNALKGLLFVADKHIQENTNNETQLQGWFETFNLVVEILHDLSTIDLPNFIVDNKNDISAALYKYLPYQNPIFDGDEDEATIIDQAKTSIYELLSLWFAKEHEDFTTAPDREVITTTLSLLGSTGMEPRHDLLVSKALKFLTSAVATDPCHLEAFKIKADGRTTDDLSPLAFEVIMLNIRLRESDVELLTSEPIEFIRRDLEGYDTDSRRRAALDFLKVLLAKLGDAATTAVLKQIDVCLQQPGWEAKDVAINLYLATAAQGTVTGAKGITQLNPLIAKLEPTHSLGVVGFFEKHVMSDLSANELIPKVNAIKYLHNFRAQTMEVHGGAVFEALATHLHSDQYVVYTYAAITIERALVLTKPGGEPVIPFAALESKALELLTRLFGLINNEALPAKKQENEFLMRCIMRVMMSLKENLVAILPQILTELINITEAIKKSPSNPRFYFYLFEAIGALIYYCSATSSTTLETMLWQPFASILEEDIDEFVPYVFQLFAALIEASPSTEAPASLTSLSELLLQTTRWDSMGVNLPAPARFLTAMIPKAAKAILDGNRLQQVVDIFEKLFSKSKRLLQESAFDLLEAMAKSFPAAALGPYFAQIMMKIAPKYKEYEAKEEATQEAAKRAAKEGRTLIPLDYTWYKLRFVRFYHLISALGVETGYGPDYYAAYAEAMGPGNFVPIYVKGVLPLTNQFTHPADRKLAVISLTKTLCDSPAFAEKYAKGWGWTASLLLDLLTHEPDLSNKSKGVMQEADPDDVSFGRVFTGLSTCKRTHRDYFPDVTNLPEWIKKQLHEADARHSGRISTFMAQRLEPDVRASFEARLA
ncbi:hypothetical protein RB594_000797 [Gaeumannomyces avenae]